MVNKPLAGASPSGGNCVISKGLEHRFIPPPCGERRAAEGSSGAGLWRGPPETAARHHPADGRRPVARKLTVTGPLFRRSHPCQPGPDHILAAEAVSRLFLYHSASPVEPPINTSLTSNAVPELTGSVNPRARRSCRAQPSAVAPACHPARPARPSHGRIRAAPRRARSPAPARHARRPIRPGRVSMRSTSSMIAGRRNSIRIRRTAKARPSAISARWCTPISRRKSDRPRSMKCR